MKSFSRYSLPPKYFFHFAITLAEEKPSKIRIHSGLTDRIAKFTPGQWANLRLSPRGNRDAEIYEFNRPALISVGPKAVGLLPR
jgi:hypothetical protein